MHAAVDGRVSAVSEQTAAARPGAGALLRDLDQAPPSELVDVCSSWLARHVAAQACVLLLADYAEASLEPVAGGAAVAHIRPQDLMDSAAGAAYREQRRVTVALDDAGEAAAGAAAGGVGGPTLVVYLPVSVRAERLGVLAVTLPGHDLGSEVGEVLADVARVLGHVLTGARRYTDRFEMLRRRRELGLAAEIQWELLPSLAFELPAFSIAGTVEPAYEIGGDNFDYAISAHRLTVSVSDASATGSGRRCWPASRWRPCATPAARTAPLWSRPAPRIGTWSSSSLAPTSSPDSSSNSTSTTAPPPSSTPGTHRRCGSGATVACTSSRARRPFRPGWVSAPRRRS